MADRVYATAFLRSDTKVASIAIRVGSQAASLPVRPGLSRVSAPFGQGVVSISLLDAGGRPISSANSSVPINDTIEVFDFNMHTFTLGGGQGPGANWTSACCSTSPS